MKTMTCKQLGGACDKEFHADSFEEIAMKSQEHGIEMIMKKDKDHIEAMEKMKELMKDSTAMLKWMESKQEEFEEQIED